MDTNTKKRGGGPKTPEGKARSAMNATRHGLTAETAVLSNENRAQFDALHHSYIQVLQPGNQLEIDLVAEIAVVRWRLQRAWVIESSMFEMSMDRSDKALQDEYESFDEGYRLTAAWTAMSGNDDAFRLLTRYEARLARRYDKALATLRQLRKDRDAPPLPSGPLPREICETNSPPSNPAPIKPRKDEAASCETNSTRRVLVIPDPKSGKKPTWEDRPATQSKQPEKPSQPPAPQKRETNWQDEEYLPGVWDEFDK